MRLWEGQSMGTFSARLGVNNGNGGDTQWVEALVDTGATFTVLPASLLQSKVGVEPTAQMTFTLASGEKRSLPIGDVRLTVEDKEGPGRVVFGEEGQYLLGATTLQMLGLMPDTSNHRLIPAPLLICDHPTHQ